MKYYTGIGSRQTPAVELERLRLYSSVLESKGFVLRSGGAVGADKAFESGVKDPAHKVILRPKHSTPEAELIAAKIHPMWSACNEYARKLHGRNVQLVLGEKLDEPSLFVIAWTWDGKISGGTRTGLVLAKERGIPCFNFAIEQEKKLFQKFIAEMEF